MEEIEFAGALSATTASRRPPDPVCAGAADGSWYDFVRGQIVRLISVFGTEAFHAEIEAAYELVCRESLAISIGERPPDFSRINHDGTPIQLALALGAFVPVLQFLGEACVPGSPNADRILLSKRRTGELASLLHADQALRQVAALLDEMAPADDRDLLADHSGAIWLGAGFAAGAEPKLRVYVNGKWGPDERRWARLGAFACHFGEASQWQSIEAGVTGIMEPLGAALTLCAGRQPTGRVYFSAYGRPLAYYEQLARSVGSAGFQHALAEFAEKILREDRQYPTQSAVWSVGIDPGSGLDYKFELCSHCAFDGDAQAAERIIDWLEAIGADPEPYLKSLGTLAPHGLSEAAPAIHCYTGIGWRGGEPYATVYLKPDYPPT
jgi:hypothetical protein